MWLRQLLGLKPSAKEVTKVVVSELEKILPFYDSRGHLSQIGPVVYSQGGCGCGCASEFQFYYDGKKLAILPCMWDCLTEPLKDQREIFVSTVKQKLGIARVDLVMSGEQPPEYIEQYIRR